MRLMFQLGCVLLLCSSLAVTAETRPYVINVKVPALEGVYYADLLELMLNASKAPDEVIQIQFEPEQLSQARWVAAVAQGEDNSIIWTMTSTEREKTLRTIRVPLMKGLMGYRALVIRKGDEAKFAQVKTIEDLARFKAGQGTHWPDVKILRANQIETFDALTKENLYKMLAAKRFDFLPRGIIEIPVEQELIHANNLTVVPNLYLHYPTDIYFFVNKRNSDLATRIETGGAAILKNGEFDKFFLSHSNMREAVDLLNMRNYKIIELNNPFLSEETLKASKPYWLDLTSKSP